MSHWHKKKVPTNTACLGLQKPCFKFYLRLVFKRSFLSVKMTFYAQGFGTELFANFEALELKGGLHATFGHFYFAT